MLSAEDNTLLTQSGAGTPMGELLRRFWLPVLLAEELPEPDGAPRKITVLGEALLAFRDTRGRVGDPAGHIGARLSPARAQSPPPPAGTPASPADR